MIEKLNLPDQVVEPDDQKDWNFEDSFITFDNEKNYNSNQQIPTDAKLINKNQVKNIDISKIKSRKVGRTALFSFKDDEVAKAA